MPTYSWNPKSVHVMPPFIKADFITSTFDSGFFVKKKEGYFFSTRNFTNREG